MSVLKMKSLKGNGDNLLKKRLILRSFDFPKLCKEFHEYFLTCLKTSSNQRLISAFEVQ